MMRAFDMKVVGKDHRRDFVRFRGEDGELLHLDKEDWIEMNCPESIDVVVRPRRN